MSIMKKNMNVMNVYCGCRIGDMVNIETISGGVYMFRISFISRNHIASKSTSIDIEDIKSIQRIGTLE